LKWFRRLHENAATLLERDDHAFVACDYKIIPTDEGSGSTGRWTAEALLSESREAYHRFTAQGRTYAVLDELAVAVVGSPGRQIVRADAIVSQETPRQSGGGLAKLAVTLIAAVSRAHRARSRGVGR
jgi:hypothetical protein